MSSNTKLPYSAIYQCYKLFQSLTHVISATNTSANVYSSSVATSYSEFI